MGEVKVSTRAFADSEAAVRYHLNRFDAIRDLMEEEWEMGGEAEELQKTLQTEGWAVIHSVRGLLMDIDKGKGKPA